MDEPKLQHDRMHFNLPFGFFAGPILWGLQIIAGYGLVTVAYNIHNKLPVYLDIFLAALVVLVGGILALRSWQAMRRDGYLVETDRRQETPNFWAIAAFWVSLLFFLLILATGITDFFLSQVPLITMPMP